MVVTTLPTGRHPLGSASAQRTPTRKAKSSADLGPSLRFKYAPPLTADDRFAESKLPTPPYEGAPSYMRSVYYYWWAFLREHDGYITTCRNGGHGDWSKLYNDFGDVRGGDFWAWWSEGAYRLFHEREAKVTRVTLEGLSVDAGREILINIPLSLDADTALNEIRRILAQARSSDGEALSKKKHRTDAASTAIYPVTSKPSLPALHKALGSLRAFRAHPVLSPAELFDIAGLKGFGPVGSLDKEVQQEKAREFNRLIREARKLVDNASKGVFPYYDHLAQGNSVHDFEGGIAFLAADAAREGSASDDAQLHEIRPYDEPPEIDVTRSLNAVVPPIENFAPNTLSNDGWPRRRPTRRNSQPDWNDLRAWRVRVTFRRGEFRFPQFDVLSGGGTKSRVLFLLSPDILEGHGRTDLVATSLLEASEHMETLYRMAVLQNRIPLHLCLPCSMFTYSAVEEEEKTHVWSHRLEREDIEDLLGILPDLRAIVLVGGNVQTAWDLAQPVVAPGIRVWRCERPTALLKHDHPDRWLAIPSRLPTWDDLA